MGRVPCCDKNGLKKGPWTPEEDLKLINYIQIHGPGNWRTLPKNAGLQRCGKSCRLRWTNYLRPDIKRGRFSLEEEDIIIQLHSIMGNRWSAIAARLPGRTDNEIKNYWNTHIRKRLLRMGIDPVTHAPRLDLLDMSSILRSVFGNPSTLVNMHGLLGAQAMMNPELLKLAAATASLESLKNEKPDLVSSPNVQVQSQAAPPLDQFTQFQPSYMEGFSAGNNMANLSCSSSPLKASTPSYLGENLILQQNQVDWLGTSALVHSLYNVNQNMGYDDSVLPTPLSSSSPNQLNSSSACVNSSAEEERDSYCCSDIFKFEIPESLDICDFIDLSHL